MIGITRKTFVNHTGDGFVAIFYDKGRSLQSLIVASLVASDVDILIKEYNNKNDMNFKYIPTLDYGIGIHRGGVNKIKYRPEYPRESSMIGFLGNVINLSNRVQESTKDHTFKIICTYPVYRDAISVIDQKYKATVEKYFTKLGKHKLRGMEGSITLYGVKNHFAKNIEIIFNGQKQKTANRKQEF
jgi:class 3 adenylate cyclase